ncbi:hypothetical protein AAMO2058_001294400 [Amorphochlora amoebiformis]
MVARARQALPGPTTVERKSSKDIGVEEPGGRRRVVGRLRLLLATFLSLAIVSSSGGLKQISNFRDHRVGRTWTHARSPVSGPLGRPAGRRVSSRDVLGLSSGMHRLSYRRSAEGVDGETGVGRGCTGEEADEALDDVEDEDDVDDIAIDIPQDSAWNAEWIVSPSSVLDTRPMKGTESLFDRLEARSPPQGGAGSGRSSKGKNFYSSKRSEVASGANSRGQYRLDRFVATMATADSRPLSRERLKLLIKEGSVSVNGKKASKPSSALKNGDLVKVEVPEPKPLRMEPEDLPIDIVFEDQDMLVVCKPAGMLTHPTPKQYNGTLVNAVLHKCKGRLSSINGIIRPGIVHRLDRDTEGLLLIAKTDRAHRHLAAQIKAHTARRTYRAIVYGDPQGQSGTVDAPLKMDHKQRRIAVDASGRHAVTHWKVLERFGGRAALVECDLETGRQHQIRAHMRFIRHPLIGDPVYGKGYNHPFSLPHLQGQALQAYKLQFTHPVTEERLVVQVPEAGYMAQALAALRDQCG